MRVLSLFLTLALLAGSADAADWAGREETRDGKLNVLNPAKPANTPTTKAPEELWRIGGDTDDDDEFFGVIGEVTVDQEGNVYLLDVQLNEVAVFTKDGHFLRRIGREGEGPGEFRRPETVFMLPDGNVGILQTRPGRIIMLTKEGDPAGIHPVPENEDGSTAFFRGGRLAGENLVLLSQQFSRKEDSFEINAALIRIDASGKETARYMTDTQKRSRANLVIDERNNGTWGMVWNASGDGRVFACRSFDDYAIQVWHADGKFDRVIRREFTPRERNAKEVEKMRVRMTPRGRWARDAKVEISKTDRTVQEIYPRANGDVWVLSSRGGLDAPSGKIGTFDVFNKAGHFVEQVTLSGQGDIAQDGFYFVGDRLFVVTGLQSARLALRGGGGDDYEESDIDPEPMAVITYDLGGIVTGMKTQ